MTTKGQEHSDRPGTNNKIESLFAYKALGCNGLLTVVRALTLELLSLEVKR